MIIWVEPGDEYTAKDLEEIARKQTGARSVKIEGKDRILIVKGEATYVDTFEVREKTQGQDED